jgi:hypothetical protein
VFIIIIIVMLVVVGGEGGVVVGAGGAVPLLFRHSLLLGPTRTDRVWIVTLSKGAGAYTSALENQAVYVCT